MIESILKFLNDNISGPYANVAVSAILLLGIALCAVLCYYLAKLFLIGLEKAVLRSPTDWDDDLINGAFTRAVSQLAPAIAVAYLLPRVFSDLSWVSSLYVLTRFYVLWAAVRIVTIFIGNLYHAFSRRENMKIYAVKGIFQMLKLIVIGIGVIIGLSILIDKTPVAILTALGASAAVLMLVFKDTILGLVASIQLSANKMLEKGDWIVAEHHGANGTVEDVSLTTVKVRNWDNSITTVPPYSLISESFSNYAPMQTSGGRRVCRAVYIDVNSVRFLSPGELDALREEGWLDGVDLDGDAAARGRVVNLRVLRDYLEGYLSSHPEVNTSMIVMVRQLDPTPSGLPLQLYFFSREVEWKRFEHIQSDIFDHVYATVSRFGLSIFQTPSGRDVADRLSGAGMVSAS